MAINKQLAARANKAESKSEGMRILIEGGAEVKEAAAHFDAPYGFAYGVAKRAGLITPTPRAAKAAPAKATAAKSTRTTKASAAKAAPARTARTAKSTASKSSTRRTAKAK